MKIYRLHLTIDHGTSAGYAYFASKRAAMKRRRDHLKESGEDPESNEVDVLAVKPTKAGIIALLNHTADHADNG